MNNPWLDAHKFLLDIEVGNSYNDVSCIKRTDKKIYLSTGVVVTLKKIKGTSMYYLTSNKKVSKGNRKYDYIDQILRDIEGFLIFKKLTDNNLKIFKKL
mgnify:CR=1 FL=1